MLKNEFNRSDARDSVPHGSACEWCDNPAEQQLIAIGETRHHTEGGFCRSCGEQFLKAVVQPLPAITQQWGHWIDSGETYAKLLAFNDVHEKLL